MRALFTLLIATHAMGFGDFPNQKDLQTIGWLVNVTKIVKLPPIKGAPRVDIEFLEQCNRQLAELSLRIAGDSEAMQLIRQIYAGFLGQDGQYLRQMLVLAARDPIERDAMIRAIQYEKGLIWWPGFDLAGEKFWSGSPKISYGNSQLKTDINILENRLFPEAPPPEWLRNLKASDLDSYEPYFKFFLELEPKTPELLEYAIRYAQDLTCQSTLKGFFEHLNLWLLDNTSGVASILANARARSAH